MRNTGRKNRDWFAFVWLAPAIVLLSAFLLKPAVETVVLSFSEKQVSDARQVRRELLSYFSERGIRAESSSRFQSLTDWQAAITDFQARHRVSLDPGSLKSGLSLEQTAEFLTTRMALQNRTGGRRFAGFTHYARLLGDANFLTAVKNNLLWLFSFTILTVVLGLAIASFVERVRWSGIAKTLIFLPMAISFVAAAVIWALMYDKDPSVGTVNAVIGGVLRLFGAGHFDGIAFLGRPDTVNAALIVSGIWMWTGYCMVIFSAALRSISTDVLEAAKIDGASVLQTFFLVEIPIILPTIIVVITTMAIIILKVFDIVYTLTGGGPFGASEVIANRMYRTAFNEGRMEYGSSMAVILFLAVLPVLILNTIHYSRERKNAR